MTDQIQRFLFDNTNVRGEVVSLEKAYAEVLERHDYPPAVTRQLGELLAAVALLTETVKLDGTMSIEVRGKGALSLLMAESNPGGELRAIAQLDEDAAIPDDDAGFTELFGEGQITITLDPREGRRYQGIVTLERDSLAGCLEDYFSRSEQLPTRLWLAADAQRSAGLLLQRLPDESLNQDEDAWDRMVQLAATLTADELLSLEQHDLLHRLFHEEQVRVFEPKALHFGCSCSRERIAGALLSLGEEELRDILAEQGGIATQCHFCHTRYQFTVAEVEAMLDDPDGPPPTVH
ncbi:Hsp33 family molecular chaperone HslO [Halomonas elongata]|uniref:33 kDa chaperonin n=2 Tax=Halomonas elongata TaxID=2746 RepID=E1V805_HALED|nr:Hsp33 family molecular chaperone HslO [Halomonas elongata]OBX37600.1 33 kDa chaperonin [Halomonas elongata]RAW07357.1 Hsp33 family molecular chaperone HslO [Halomonas elongata]WBF18809.1 Hsp33 family molecular chaperone HslO [Halomonas elongata]WPU47665.1 Hsp33 family molecular chaperone HslO [Halomonas elongata DSM 2581]WVI72313.1 Hsp33 family molecular chaperone HslO [Halomonas elongata]